MTFAWKVQKHRIVGTLHTLEVGEGPLALRAYVKSAGPGGSPHFNWWVSPAAADDYMAEHPDRLQGGEGSLRMAKMMAEHEAFIVVVKMATSFGCSIKRACK